VDAVRKVAAAATRPFVKRLWTLVVFCSQWLKNPLRNKNVRSAGKLASCRSTPATPCSLTQSPVGNSTAGQDQLTRSTSYAGDKADKLAVDHKTSKFSSLKVLNMHGPLPHTQHVQFMLRSGVRLSARLSVTRWYVEMAAK